MAVVGKRALCSLPAGSSASGGGQTSGGMGSSFDPRKPAARQSASKQCWTRPGWSDTYGYTLGT